MLVASFEAQSALGALDYSAAASTARAALPGRKVAKPAGGREEWIWNRNHAFILQALGEAQYGLKEYAEAERSLREAIRYQNLQPALFSTQRREIAYVQALHAMALARLDRQEEARKVIGPVLEMHRTMRTPEADDLTEQFEFALALHASALASPTKAQAQSQLAEASSLIDRLPASMRRLNSVSAAREAIAEERKKR